MTDTPTENNVTDDSEVKTGLASSGAAKMDKKQMELLNSRLLAAKFGDMVTVLMQSPHHKNIPLSDLRDRLVPPLVKQQYRVAEARKGDSGEIIPVGLILWARVSDEVHERLKASEGPLELRGDEWFSGEKYWIIDAIGQERFLTALLTDLRKKDFVGKSIHYRARTETGTEIRCLEEPEAETPAPDDTQTGADNQAGEPKNTDA